MKLRITDTEIITKPVIRGKITTLRNYSVDCPFEKEDIVKGGLEEFKYRILKLFKMYGEGGTMTAQYDFEQEQEFDEENRLDIYQGQADDDKIKERLNSGENF